MTTNSRTDAGGHSAARTERSKTMNQAAKELCAKYARRSAAIYRRDIEGDEGKIERAASEAFREALLSYGAFHGMDKITGAQEYFETVFCNQFTYGAYDPDGTYRRQVLESFW
jgi:hypothetical protein